MVAPIVLTANNIGAFVFSHTGQNESVLVNSDTDVDITLIDTRDIRKLLIQIINSGATNSLNYSIYGYAKEVSTAPAFVSSDWNELKPSTTISPLSEKTETLTDSYSFVLIRMKRATSGLDTTAKIYVRAKK